jgi:NAD/NADP transhydrogenase alpha subunit
VAEIFTTSPELTMRIGVPKEIKVHEYRVAMVPAGVRELVAAGHQVIVETNAGAGIGVSDMHYDRQHGGRGVRCRRPDRQGQGAAVV